MATHVGHRERSALGLAEAGLDTPGAAALPVMMIGIVAAVMSPVSRRPLVAVVMLVALVGCSSSTDGAAQQDVASAVASSTPSGGARVPNRWRTFLGLTRVGGHRLSGFEAVGHGVLEVYGAEVVEG